MCFSSSEAGFRFQLILQVKECVSFEQRLFQRCGVHAGISMVLQGSAYRFDYFQTCILLTCCRVRWHFRQCKSSLRNHKRLYLAFSQTVAARLKSSTLLSYCWPLPFFKTSLTRGAKIWHFLLQCKVLKWKQHAGGSLSGIKTSRNHWGFRSCRPLTVAC